MNRVSVTYSPFQSKTRVRPVSGVVTERFLKRWVHANQDYTEALRTTLRWDSVLITSHGHLTFIIIPTYHLVAA